MFIIAMRAAKAGVKSLRVSWQAGIPFEEVKQLWLLEPQREAWQLLGQVAAFEGDLCVIGCNAGLLEVVFTGLARTL